MKCHLVLEILQWNLNYTFTQLQMFCNKGFSDIENVMCIFPDFSFGITLLFTAIRIEGPYTLERHEGLWEWLLFHSYKKLRAVYVVTFSSLILTTTTTLWNEISWESTIGPGSHSELSGWIGIQTQISPLLMQHTNRYTTLVSYMKKQTCPWRLWSHESNSEDLEINLFCLYLSSI